MSEYVIGALITAAGAVLLFVLNRMFGTDSAASVVTQWKDWSHEQGQRILAERLRVDALEHRIDDLEKDLADERESNRVLTQRNERQSSMLTSLIRWAILLRDEIVRLGGQVPPAPVEVENALTTLDP